MTFKIISICFVEVSIERSIVQINKGFLEYTTLIEIQALLGYHIAEMTSTRILRKIFSFPKELHNLQEKQQCPTKFQI